MTRTVKPSIAPECPDGSDVREFQAFNAAACAVSDMLAVAHALLTADRRLDLAGLDDAVGALCAKALDMPREMGARARPMLIAVLARLDYLIAAAREQVLDPT